MTILKILMSIIHVLYVPIDDKIKNAGIIFMEYARILTCHLASALNINKTDS